MCIRDSKCSDVVGGAFVGATVMLSLQAMMTSSQWSYVAKGVATMDPIVASSGVVVKGNETFFSAFEAIAALAGLMCALLILNAIELSFCLEYFCDNDAAKLRAQRFADEALFRPPLVHLHGARVLGVRAAPAEETAQQVRTRAVRVEFLSLIHISEPTRQY